MHRAGLRVVAIDAAQFFDFEHRAKQRLEKDMKLRVGIVGFGNFGQFLAKRLVDRGHTVIATSRTPYDEVARSMGVAFYSDPNDFCEEHPEVVLLASSILSCENVFKSIPVQRLKRNTLFVDVLSVKVFPKQMLLRQLPPEVDILCTHPIKCGWGEDPRRQKRVEAFLKFFREEGCSMVEMSCEEHDRQAASTQFITHTVGRVLGAMQLAPTEINTKGYDALLNLVNNTTNDSFDLYYGLFLYNQNATDELERLEAAVDSVKKQLFGRLHDIARKQLFPDSPARTQLPAPVVPASPSSSASSASTVVSAAAGAASDSNGSHVGFGVREGLVGKDGGGSGPAIPSLLSAVGGSQNESSL
ncbi:MAG: hypothetical protein WDW38_005888 [Sanguina aurantia]